jgi:hypothetical protein
MKKIFGSILMLAVVCSLLASLASAQVSFTKTIRAICGVTQTVTLGVNPGNTDGIDASAPAPYNEAPAPPYPPSIALEARFFGLAGRISTQLGSTGCYKDIRNSYSSTQVDTFHVRVLGDNLTTTTLQIQWDNDLNLYATSWTIKPFTGSAFPTTDMMATTSVSIPSDGATSQYDVLIIKVGALSGPTPGPTFGLSSSSLSFSATPGSITSQTVTVTNSGNTNPLNISAISAPGGFAVTPAAPVTVTAGGNRIFTVTFTAPSHDTTITGNVVFTHNAPGSPSNLAVTGNVQSPPSQGGVLQFASATRSRKDNTTGYTDSLQLINYVGKPLQSLQFKIVTNSTTSNGNLVILRSVERGSNIPAANWSFNSRIIHGVANSDGAAKDTVTVVIYGIGRADTLPAGSYTSLVKFAYDVINIAEPDTQWVKDTIMNVQSSIPIYGTSAGINAGNAQVITVTNRTKYGDVNNDDHVDILDLLMVVDHILGRDTLSAAEFSRANVAPWPAGSSVPTPDGVVDVRDLTVIQGIILYNQYPDSSRLSKIAPRVFASHLSKSAADTKITFSVTKNGIAIRLNSKVQVRGIQFTMKDVNSNSQVSSIVSKDFTSSAALLKGTTLRSVLYAQSANSLAPGNTLVAVINLPLTDETAVEVEDVLVADANNQALNGVEWEILNKEDVSVPTAYRLDQNYPNPFNPSTTFTFSVPQTSSVRIAVYNLLGQEVRTLFAGQMEQGTQTLTFDGKDKSGKTLSTGMYIYRMTAGSFVATKKMMLLK